ncbi:stage II sporulation protein M [Leuconostocaceae bacterium ESL0723]|nr:stage II sporulation protein M [Leuconostocaceae bacterium ESL0723]
MKSIYQEFNWRRVAQAMGLLLVIMLLAMVVTYLVNPNVHEATKAIMPRSSESFSAVSGTLGELRLYIVNNCFTVPLGMLIFALLPIPYLYLWQPIFTFIGPGVLYGLVARINLSLFPKIILSTTSHNLVEMLAFATMIVILQPLNQWVCSFVWRHRTERSTTLVSELKQVLVRWFTIALPIFILAAVLETYLDTWLGGL